VPSFYPCSSPHGPLRKFYPNAKRRTRRPTHRLIRFPRRIPKRNLTGAPIFGPGNRMARRTSIKRIRMMKAMIVPFAVHNSRPPAAKIFSGHGNSSTWLTSFNRVERPQRVRPGHRGSPAAVLDPDQCKRRTGLQCLRRSPKLPRWRHCSYYAELSRFRLGGRCLDLGGC
jgi:hypothetical protein